MLSPIVARVSPVRLFLIAFAVYAYFMPRWADWNIDSRIDLVHALVVDRTVSIDRYHYNTWDKAVYRGHFYSDKAPGTAFLGAVVYAGFRVMRASPVVGDAIRGLEASSAWNEPIALGRTATQKQPAAKGRILGGCQRSGIKGNVQYIPWGNRLVPPFREWALSKYVVTVGVVGLLSAAFMAFFYWFLGVFGLGRGVRLAATGLYAFATVALPYSTVFYSHQLVAAFLFVAFALLLLYQRNRIGRWAAPVAGFLLGTSLLTEYTVAIVVLFVGLYALWVFRRWPVGVGVAAAAGAIPLAVLFAYNAAAFGNGFDTGYSHDFCWSAAQAGGYAGFTYPRLGPLFDLTFGTFRGLFFMSPFLLLAVPGAWIMRRRRLGGEAAVCLVTSAVFIVAISAYWGWNGGQVDGPRYLVPIVPFLAFPVAFALEAARRAALWTAIVVVLGMLSTLVTWALFLGGELFPTSWLRDPLLQYSLPALAGNHIALNAGAFFGLSGWESLVPLLGLVLALLVWPGGLGGTAGWRRELASRPARS